MTERDEPDDQLTDYLLGALPEAEQADLERRLFEDDELYERLLAAEDDLRYDYAQGRLSEAERGAFERRMLRSPDDRERLAFAEGLLAATAARAASKRAASAPARPAERGSIWRSVAAFLRTPAGGLATAASLVAVALSAWLLVEVERARTEVARERTERVERERELSEAAAGERERADRLAGELELERERRAAIERQLSEQSTPQDVRPAAPVVATFLLLPGQVRGAGGANRVVVSRGTEQVRLRLAVGADGDHRSYGVRVLDPEGREVLRRQGLSAREGKRGREVVLAFPAGLLAPDDYELELAGDAEPIATYYFSVASTR